MGKRNRTTGTSPQGKNRHISVRGVRRDPPDLQKFGAAIVALVLAQAEAEAAAEAQRTTPHEESPSAADDAAAAEEQADA